MVTLVGILRRLGPAGRRVAWNFEFRHRASFAGRRSSIMVDLLREHLGGKRVVELACGDGSLAAALAGHGWASYEAFDISSVAIGRAEARRLPGVRFHVSDMEAWTPREPFDLLLIEEAIYYLPPPRQTALLDRAFAAMGPSGLAVVVLHSVVKHAALVERLTLRYRLVDDRREGERCYLLLAPPA